MLKEALNLIKETESKSASMKMRRITEQEKELPNNTRGKRSPSLQLQAIIRSLESMLSDMKSHLKDEHKEEARMLKAGIKHNEMMFLYYEEQIDSLEGNIKQLKALIPTLKEGVDASYQRQLSTILNMYESVDLDAVMLEEGVGSWLKKAVIAAALAASLIASHGAQASQEQSTDDVKTELRAASPATQKAFFKFLVQKVGGEEEATKVFTNLAGHAPDFGTQPSSSSAKSDGGSSSTTSKTIQNAKQSDPSMYPKYAQLKQKVGVNAAPSEWLRMTGEAPPKNTSMGTFKNEKTRLESYVKESASKFKVGDRVIAKEGPHKGQTHTIIHLYDDGSMNIKPTGLHARDIKYRLGAVKAKPEQVQSISESTEMSDDLAAKKIFGKIKGTPGLTRPRIEQYVTKYIGMVGKKASDVKYLTAQVMSLLQDSGLTEGFSPAEISKITTALKSGADISDGLMDKLVDLFIDDMPYGTAKARDGDPYNWVTDHLDSIYSKSGAPGIQKALS